MFLHLAEQRGLGSRFEADSAGTGGWHAGDPPDSRSSAVASKHGIDLVSRARQVQRAEHDRWDLVIAMDRRNLADLLAMGFEENRVRLLRSFDAEASAPDVPDPYYGGEDGFDTVYAMIRSACERLLDKLESVEQC